MMLHPESASNPSLILKDSKHGKGVFAGRAFQKGEQLLEFQGNLYASEELPSPYSAVSDKYMQVGEDMHIGPPGGIDDFINHSCDANSYVSIPAEISGGGVVLVALRDIAEGEELTFDYSTTMYDDDWTMNCECGSQQCRRVVSEFRYLPEDIKQKYISLGIVPEYILRNI